MDHPRIEDLRRRILTDPASVVFAQLAEEYRRVGQFAEAERTCRAGLAQRPTYLSARVTLGRALIGLKRFDEARAELEAVLLEAPDHLAAVRAYAELPPKHARAVTAGSHQHAAVRAVARLERWLAAILRDRATRGAFHPPARPTTRPTTLPAALPTTGH